MEAHTRHLGKIFDPTIQYLVPLFQRPYVWTEQENLQPLWEDLQLLLDKHLSGREAHPHFLGAVVLEQLANPTGSIEVRQVIDGQQRFTTLQILLMAARDHARATEFSRFAERFSEMVANRANQIDHAGEVYKVWPTNSDRKAFKAVHEATSPSSLESSLKADPKLRERNIVLAYQYFHSRLGEWLAGELDDVDDERAPIPKGMEDRLESLWQVIKGHLQLVVIDLGKDDETQVIFETLNARGAELLPGDLIKNLLFRQAAAASSDVEDLYERYWHPLEERFWREEVKQGRLTRPRIDVFINYYLTLMTREEVRSTNLFGEFKAFALRGAASDASSIPVPKTPTEHIVQLARYAGFFAEFGSNGAHPRLAAFVRTLGAVDTTTVYPFLLHAYAELMPDREGEFNSVLDALESFLMRRMICGLTPKNYNRLFVELIRAVDKSGELSEVAVRNFLSSGAGESVRFPTDKEVLAAATNLPLYGRLAQNKVRAIFEALDRHSYDRKSELVPLPSGLEIEHVLPQSWTAHWPLPDAAVEDEAKARNAADRRDALLNTLGNLTLITGSLNPALSNSPWSVKRPELLKFGKLNLTRYFHGEHAASWDEAAIEARTELLAKQMLEIWQGPAIASSAA